jgi:DNA-binding HxlR family transcriptional regulator
MGDRAEQLQRLRIDGAHEARQRVGDLWLVGRFEWREPGHAATLTLLISKRKHRHPIADLFDLLGRRWALRVLWELRAEPLRYAELRARCEEMSTSVLAQRLRELADAGIVEQRDGAYALTTAGRELLEHLAPLNDWAKKRL